MRHLDLFAGIGGFSLAAQWMGWTTVAQVEWDEWCQKVLAKNFPDALRFGDIVEFNKMLENGEIITDTKELRDRRESRTLEGKTTTTKCKDDGAVINGICENGFTSIGHIDIITGGFPCQPFSHAGKRKGTDDSRYLWPAMLETIRRVKPAYVVGENVAGLVSMENGKTLDRILSDLEDEGYTTEQVIIPACAVGAWHRRDRIWIVAYDKSTGIGSKDRGYGGQGRRTGHGIQREVVQQGREAQDNSVGTGNKTITHSPNPRTGEDNGGLRKGIGGVGRGEGTNEEDAANCDSQGLQGWKNGRGVGSIGTKRDQQPERYGQCLGGEDGTTQCSVGGMASRLPRWVDGYWDREPEGVSRVATGVKDRVNRLKGLGNAIVPQVALEIFKAIDELYKPR